MCKECGYKVYGNNQEKNICDHIFDAHDGEANYTTKHETKTIHHDAITHTETVHHDAVTHTETVSNGYTCTRCGAHKD